MTSSKNINIIRTVMQNAGGGGFGGVSNVGGHPAGHFTIVSDPAGGFYVSPGDPAFWLRHSMIDCTWHIWQTQKLSNRMQAIAGGTSMMGLGGRQQSLEDLVD